MKNITNATNEGNSAFLFVIYWFCALAALLAWKGSAYSETAIIRKYLGMTEPSASQAWWTGAVGIAALLIVILAYLLLKTARTSGWGDSMRHYVNARSAGREQNGVTEDMSEQRQPVQGLNFFSNMRTTLSSLILVVGALLSARADAGSICIAAPGLCNLDASPSVTVSTGVDGAFQTQTDTTLVTGIYNFTDVLIGDNATLSFTLIDAPQDIYLLSTGDVTINGSIISPGSNLHISAANNFLLTGRIDVTGGTLNITSGNTITSTGSVTTGPVIGNGGDRLTDLVGGTPTLVPVPPSSLLLISGLPLVLRRRPHKTAAIPCDE